MKSVPKKKKKNKKPKTGTSVLLCDCQKHIVPVVEVKKVVDRRTLNYKQYVELLAETLTLPTHNVEIYKVKKEQNIFPSRYHKLAIPHPRRMVENWKTYQHVLRPEHIKVLKSLLTKQDTITTNEANKYFKLLAARRRRSRKKRRTASTGAICCKNAKAKKYIDKIVNAVINYFIKRPLCQVKDRHTIITTELISTIIGNKIAQQLKRLNQDTYSITLYQTIDQISVWIDQKVIDIDTIDLDENTDELSLSTSGTDTNATDTDELISDDFMKSKKKEPSEKGESILPDSTFSEREIHVIDGITHEEDSECKLENICIIIFVKVSSETRRSNLFLCKLYIKILFIILKV